MLFLKILGTILKIIGILLLCILLLLLFILLVLLFVPIRYRASVVKNGGELSVQAQVSYIFRLIRLPVRFEDGRLHIKLTVFGITLFSSDQKDGHGAGKTGRHRRKKPGAKEERVTGEPPKERQEQPECAAEPDRPEAAGEGKDGQPGQDEAGQSLQAEADTGETVEGTQEATPHGLFRPIAGLVSRIKGLARKIRGFFQKLAGIIRNLKDKICFAETKFTDIADKGKLILAFLRDEGNKNGIKYAGKSIFRLLKHVFPYKMEGEIRFATGNPYSLGRALSVLGMLYPVYAKPLRLSADFMADHFLLEGRVRVKGRIRFGTILWIVFKLWRKGKIMRLLSSAKELQRELSASAEL